MHSFQSAKFKNYEIILVDDGSKDGSDLLCDKLALMDNKVRVVHIEDVYKRQALLSSSMSRP